MGLKHLTNVHAAGYADRIEDDVDRRAVLEVRHIFGRQDTGDHALVTVPSSHLVAFRDLASLGDGDTDDRLDSRCEIIDHFRVLGPTAVMSRLAVGRTAGLVVLLGPKSRLDHLSAFAVRDAQ